MKHTLLLLISCASLCLIAGCATSSRQQNIDKLNQARLGALACKMYAQEHGGQYPSNLQATAGYAKAGFVNQLKANFDLVYSGDLANVAKPDATIVLKEKQARQNRDGKWVKAYAFVDCHSEIHMSEDGNFDKWEDERIIKP